MPNVIELLFIKPGLMTTIQDLGRTGYQAIGVPVGGALDRRSYRLANRLVGNTPESPVVEMTMIGAEIWFGGNALIAITGGDFSPTLDGQPVAANHLIAVSAGSTLQFGVATKGWRCYLAIAGKWQVKQWLGSASPLPNAGILVDHVIGQGSRVEIEPHPTTSEPPYPIHIHPISRGFQTIQVTAGPEFRDLTRSAIARLFGNTYHISSQSNQMGCRLLGKPVMHDAGKEMISSGIVPGTIQLTPSGQLIILLAHAQTVGGYPRVLNVVRDHLDLMAQLRPQQAIRFELVD